MKKTLRILVVLVLALTAFSLFACSDPNVNAEDNLFVFTVDSKDYAVTATTTVKDYMDKLAADEKVSFKFSGGMVTEINGQANTLNFSSCWMLYTDDAEMSNADWGTYDYNGKTLGSAMLGAEALVVKDGCTYAWVYTTF